MPFERFTARISCQSLTQPFVSDIPAAGKVIVALCAVHSVIIDSVFSGQSSVVNHFRVHSHFAGSFAPNLDISFTITGSGLSGFNVRKHGWKTGSLKVRTGE